MNEEDFKLKVVKDIAEIKTSLKHLLNAQNMQRPCIQDSVTEKLKACEKGVGINRKLIFFLLTTVVAVIAKITI